MKKWIQKFVDQISFDVADKKKITADVQLSEEMATLLFFIDTYGKNIIETNQHTPRKARETLDEFARELVKNDPEKIEKSLFHLRQYFTELRLDEATFVQKTFHDFRNIIWEFVDHLSEDISMEQKESFEMNENIDQLRQAVEVNSVDEMKSQAKKFIDSYIKIQSKKTTRKTKSYEKIKDNLSTIKKQLIDANNSLRLDHLTKAFNRKSFDEQMTNQLNLLKVTNQPATLIMLDIDFFKRINDTFGHALGDFVLIACVKMLKELFPRDNDYVARIGGEEFAIILPDYHADQAAKKAEMALAKIRSETIIEQDMRVQFTVSMGIAELQPNESVDSWIRRADQALYKSKNSGRDRYTLASTTSLNQVA